MSDSIDDLPWDAVVAGLRSGDDEICTAFWRRYGATLQQVASRQLSARVQQRVGPDDVVQSACRTFFRRVTDGQFDLPNSDALWRLLCAITVTKARRAARNQMRQKRGGDRDISMDATATESGIGDHLPDQAAALVDQVALRDQVEHLITLLSPDECRVLELKLQQFSSSEIAEQLGCSDRTVRRLVNNIQHHWTAALGAADAPPDISH